MPGSTHLDTLTIRGFRGLADVDFQQLGQFNLIVGRNDVGKTSVLESVFLTAGFAVLPLPVVIQNQRLRMVQNSRDLSLLFHDLRANAKIEFIATTSSDTRRLTISATPTDVVIKQDPRLRGQVGNGEGPNAGGTSFSSTPETPYALRYDATLAPRSHGKPERHYVGTLSVTEGQVKALDHPESAPLADEIIVAKVVLPGFGYDSESISEVLVRKEQDRLIQYLRAVNPRIEGITVSGDTAYVDIGLDRMIPINMCGSGLVRAAHILSTCIVGNIRILLIDEIGNGLHHSAVAPLLEAIMTICEKEDIQVFMTTHSLEVLQCIQGLLSDNLIHFRPKIECYALAPDKNGRVRTYRYDYEQFDHVISKRIEIR